MTLTASSNTDRRLDELERSLLAELDRLGVPDDIGSVVAFLLSDEAGWLTGQNLVIDGGLTLTGGV